MEPIRIWRLDQAPEKYRTILAEEREARRVDAAFAADAKWVASIETVACEKMFWGTWKERAMPDSLAVNFATGVFFHRTERMTEIVYFFTDEQFTG